MVRKRRIRRPEGLSKVEEEGSEEPARSHSATDRMFVLFVGAVMVLSAVAYGFYYLGMFGGAKAETGIPADAVYLFEWDSVPGPGTDQLVSVLDGRYGFEFSGKPAASSRENGTVIVLSDGKATATLTLDEATKVVSLDIGDGQTYPLLVYGERGKRAVYASNTPLKTPTAYETDLGKFLNMGPAEEADAFFVPATVRGRLPSLVFFGTLAPNATLTREQVAERVRGLRGVANVTLAPAEAVTTVHVQALLDVDHILDQNLTKSLADELLSLGSGAGLVDPAVYQPAFVELPRASLNMTVGGSQRLVGLRNRFVYSFLKPPVEENATVTLWLRGKVTGDQPSILPDGREDVMGFEQGFSLSVT